PLRLPTRGGFCVHKLNYPFVAKDLIVSTPTSNQPPKIRNGVKVEVVVEKLVYGGRGMARLNGMVIFVEGAAPGDRVNVRIKRKKRHHAEAVIEEILEPSPLRREAPCSMFGRCGGCSWQHIDDQAQTQAKADQVRESLEHVAGLRDLPADFFRPAITAPSPWHYRNKLDYSFAASDDEEGAPSIGFHRKGNFRRVVPIPNCLIHPEPFDALLDEVRIWMN